MTEQLFICPHWTPRHNPARDLKRFEEMRFPWIKTFQAGIDQVKEALNLPHKPSVVIRLYEISSAAEASKLYLDPKLLAQEHALFWHDWAHTWGLTDDERRRCCFEGLNEPDAQFSADTVHLVDEYSTIYGYELSNYELIPCVGQINTGWPYNTGPDTPPAWEPYRKTIKMLRDVGGYLGTHEYFRQGPDSDEWPWNPGRILQRPEWMHGVPVLITECGYDAALGTSARHHGWQGHMSAEEYRDKLDRYAEKVAGDADVIAAFPFLHDFEDRFWESFDTVPLLEQGKWPMAQKTFIPHVGPPGADNPTVPKLVYVIATAGANIRNAPVTGQVLTAVPYGEQVSIVGGDDTSGWFRVKYRHHEGWMSPSLVSTDKPPTVSLPTPVPPQGEDKWKRSIAFTAKWEGAYQNVHNDKGNWTGGEVGKGELKGTNWGISAASYPHLDIKNLTREQAHEIYHRDYWQKSGADKLDWPGCLIVFDTAVLHGVGTAKLWLAESGPDPYMFAAKRLRSYTKMGNWDFWGKAWVLRVCDLLEESGES